MYKNLFFFVLIFLLCFFPAAVSAQETGRVIHSFEDWEYVTNETGITLTAYLGRSGEPELPAEIYGIRVTMLGDELFKNCTFLKSVTIPDTVMAMGISVFQGCSSLEYIGLPRYLQQLEDYSFRYCTALERIRLPEFLTVIGAYSFNGCIRLTEISIPDSVTWIGESAFDDCSSLEEIKISKNLSFLEGNAFRNTPWLSAQTDEFVLVGNNVLLKWNGNGAIANVPYGVTMITDAFAENVTVENINLPATVTRIGQNAFREAVNLKNVYIPDSVTRIDSYAFMGERSLRSISLPESITSMGSSVFRNCEKLAQIELPPQLSMINSYLLADCGNLSEVAIPSAVQTIHGTAFSGSDQVRLRVAYGSEGERFAQENRLAYTYSLQQTQDFIYSRNEDGIQILQYIGNLFDVEVPAEIDGLPVNRINTAAFQNNNVARRVILPDSVTTIGDWAFSYMDSLKAIRMPSGLSSLGADAFTNSPLLKVINLPENVEQIGVEPFEGDDHLVICAKPGSSTEQLLTGSGYRVRSGRACMEKSFLAEFGLEPTATPKPVITRTPSPTPAMTQTLTSEPKDSPTEMPSAAITPAETEMPPDETLLPSFTAVPSATAILPQQRIIYIGEGTVHLTRAHLERAAYEVTLVLPDSVTDIDEDILDGHVITLVAKSGSAADDFAKKWNIQFVSRAW